MAANQKEYGNAMADCSVALENMMLAAVSLDIGSCWINQLHWLDDNKYVREYMLKLGLSKDETICGDLHLVTLKCHKWHLLREQEILLLMSSNKYIAFNN